MLKKQIVIFFIFFPVFLFAVDDISCNFANLWTYNDETIWSTNTNLKATDYFNFNSTYLFSNNSYVSAELLNEQFVFSFPIYSQKVTAGFDVLSLSDVSIYTDYSNINCKDGLLLFLTINPTFYIKDISISPRFDYIAGSLNEFSYLVISGNFSIINGFIFGVTSQFHNSIITAHYLNLIPDYCINSNNAASGILDFGLLSFSQKWFTDRLFFNPFFLCFGGVLDLSGSITEEDESIIPLLTKATIDCNGNIIGFCSGCNLTASLKNCELLFTGFMLYLSECSIGLEAAMQSQQILFIPSISAQTDLKNTYLTKKGLIGINSKFNFISMNHLNLSLSKLFVIPFSLSIDEESSITGERPDSDIIIAYLLSGLSLSLKYKF